MFLFEFHQIFLGYHVIPEGYFVRSQQFIGGQCNFPLINPFELFDLFEDILLLNLHGFLHLFFHSELFLADLSVTLFSVDEFFGEVLALLLFALGKLLTQHLQLHLHLFIDVLYLLLVASIGLLKFYQFFTLNRYQLGWFLVVSPFEAQDVAITVHAEDCIGSHSVQFAARKYFKPWSLHCFKHLIHTFATVQITSCWSKN